MLPWRNRVREVECSLVYGRLISTTNMHMRLCVCQLGKVFGPDPADELGRVVLVPGKPELALFCYDIEDLKSKLATVCV
jgi:hypothetical protein